VTPEEPEAGDPEAIDEALRQVFEGDSAPFERLAGVAHGTVERAFGPLLEDDPGGEECLPEVAGYRVLGRLGSGGMGVVYEAEQIAPPRRVALKVLPSRVRDPRRARLFQYEIELLARLQHPDIAGIIAAGTTADGRPFFTMERVVGEAIDRAAAARGLTIRDRVRWLIRVALAVQHAHLNQVVHRDLKPSNVLIDAENRPKVLDFGVALALDRVADGARGAAVGTLAYMSPEQLRGDGGGSAEDDCCDNRADVYSLGVLAYELLTSRLPFGDHHTPRATLEARILEGRPLAPREVTPALDADLEAVILRAMHRDPAARYQSAREFAVDLDAWFGHRAVTANPPRPLRRLRLAARRHPGFALGAACTMLTICIAAVTLLAQSRTAAAAAANAARYRGETDVLRSLFSGFTWASDPLGAPSADTPLAELIPMLEINARADLASRAEVEPLAKAFVGRWYRSLAMYDEAETRLVSALAELRATRPGGDPALAETIHQLGVLRHAEERFAEAEALYREALPMLESALSAVSPEAMETRADLSRLMVATNRPDEGVALATRSVGLARGKEGNAATLARALVDLAEAQVSTYRNRDAIPVIEEAVPLALAEHGEFSPFHCRAIRLRTSAYVAAGRLDEAYDHLSEYLERVESQLGTGHLYGAMMLRDRAQIQRARGRFEERVADLAEAARRTTERLGPTHPFSLEVRIELAECLVICGRRSEAKREAAALIADGESTRSQAIENRTRALALEGRLAFEEGRYDDARAAGEKALALREARNAPVRESTISLLSLLADVEFAVGDPDAAERAGRRELEARRLWFRGRDAGSAALFVRVARVVLRKDRAAAEALLAEARDWLAESGAASALPGASVEYEIGMLWREFGEETLALEALERARQRLAAIDRGDPGDRGDPALALAIERALAPGEPR
jgi:tetratricopeptide (TPR) repeat protein